MSEVDMNLFKPPLARTIGVLDKALFSKTISIAAARVRDNKDISLFRQRLEKSKDLLRVERIPSVRSAPETSPASKGAKCLLLQPNVKPGAPDTWSPTLREAVRDGRLSVVPFDLAIDYDFFSYYDVMKSILPEELHDEIPVGFNTAGHVAHLNLREQYLPYKSVIAQVLLDKVPQVKTVINKTDNVGTESVFRTFSYEVLAGPNDLNVEVKENDCTFRFDYSKVYWNSKLDTEHSRLVDMFQPGEVVCDVMAGIGPFAVPAGKKGVFVWANDMNPDSYLYLQQAIVTNKVQEFVFSFNEDGINFIPRAARLVYEAATSGRGATIRSKTGKTAENPRRATVTRTIPIPPTISHFVMNLPASAIEFLPAYRGIYYGHEDLFAPSTARKLPLVHVHCFSIKSEDGGHAQDICDRISRQLGVEMRHGNAENDYEIAIHDVRDVAPKKRMYCASFRLPAEVAFAPRS